MSNCANGEFVRKNYICSVCNFCSLYPASIRRHIRLKHAGDGHLINRRESGHVSSTCYSKRNNPQQSMVNRSTMTSPILTQNGTGQQESSIGQPGTPASSFPISLPNETNMQHGHVSSNMDGGMVFPALTHNNSNENNGITSPNTKKNSPISSIGSKFMSSTPLQNKSMANNDKSSLFSFNSPELMNNKSENSLISTRSAITTPPKKVEVIHSGTDLGLSSAGSDVYDISLIEQFKIFISGPSRCGKTVWVTDFLLNISPRLCKEVPETILYVFATWQPQYDDIKDSKLVDVFIQDDDSLESKIKRYITGKPLLIIFDDLISSNNLAYIADLFMVHGRHNHVSCIFISQMMFPNNIAIRSISRNSNYLVLFKNPRYNQDISELAKQMTPGQPYLKMIYATATEDPFSYLFINVTQECKPAVKYLSHLFNENNIVRAYVVT